MVTPFLYVVKWLARECYNCPLR